MRREAPLSLVSKPADRVRRFAITDDSVDRYNTTFDPKGWSFRNFEKNPVVLLNHGGGMWGDDQLPVLGRGSIVGQVGNAIHADVEFFTPDKGGHPLGERVLQLIDQGVLASSIRADIDPAGVEYNADRETGDDATDYWYPPLDYKRQDLVEFSIVYLPGNPNAVPVGRAGLEPEMRSLLDSLELNALRGRVDRLQGDARARVDLGNKLRAAARAAKVPKPKPAPEIERYTIPDGLDLGATARETIKSILDEESRSIQARLRGRLTPE